METTQDKPYRNPARAAQDPSVGSPRPSIQLMLDEVHAALESLESEIVGLESKLTMVLTPIEPKVNTGDNMPPNLPTCQSPANERLDMAVSKIRMLWHQVAEMRDRVES